jgi:FkbM family methyltransferase
MGRNAQELQTNNMYVALLILTCCLCAFLQSSANSNAKSASSHTYHHDGGGFPNPTHVLKCLHSNNVADMTWTNDRLSIITTRTVHPFLMTTIHNDLDRAVSLKLRDHGLWDPQVLGPMQFIIQEKPCDSDSFVLDVGANIGFFSGFSLSMGCSTAIFEPQALPASAVAATLCLNYHAHKKAGVKSQLVQLPVSQKPKLAFPTTNSLHQHNTGGAGAADCHNQAAANSKECIEMNTVHLDAFVYGTATRQVNVTRTVPGHTIRVLKIDSEGYESDVIATMGIILKTKTAENILFEMIPHVMGLDANIIAVKALFQAGYSVAECPFQFLEGVRQVNKPFIKEVVPLTVDSAVALITAMFNEKDHGNWKKKHYTDLWASVDPDIFARYNKVVYPA